MEKISYTIDIDHYLMLIENYFNCYKPIDGTYLKFLPTLRMPLDKSNDVHIKEIEKYKNIGGIDKYISNIPYHPWKCLAMVTELILEYRHSSFNHDIFKRNPLKSNSKSFTSGLTDEDILISYIPNISIDDGKQLLLLVSDLYSKSIEPIMNTKDELTIWSLDYTFNIITLNSLGNVYEFRYKELLEK